MKFLKTKSAPKPVVALERGPLAEKLKEACAAAEEYIETIAAKQKAEAPTIPLDWHRMNLRLRYGKCACKCALALLDQEKE
jgi:hypothetical protein